MGETGHGERTGADERLEDLARRPFAELDDGEKAELGRLHAERSRRMAQALVDNLNRNVRAKDAVFAQLRSADERNVHRALERMRKQHRSLEGADGLLAFFHAMLDVMGGNAGK